MSEVARPFFMTNDDWFEYDEKKGRFVLTAKATEKAIESYKQFYKQLQALNVPKINF